MSRWTSWALLLIFLQGTLPSIWAGAKHQREGSVAQKSRSFQAPIYIQPDYTLGPGLLLTQRTVEPAKTDDSPKKGSSGADSDQKLDPEAERLWQKVKDDPPFKKSDKKDSEKKYSEKFREKENRKIRGYWLSGWYDFIWTFTGLGYVVGSHFLSGDVAANSLSSPGEKYSYSFGETTGGTSGGRAGVSITPYSYMKLNQLVFGSLLLYGDFHPAITLPLLRFTRYSMYHLFTGSFIELVAGRGDIRQFSNEAGIPFAIMFSVATVDWLINLFWLSDVYNKAYERGLYRPKKKVSVDMHYQPDQVAMTARYIF